MRRARLFSAVLGFLLALAGVVLDNRLLVWSAMAVLAVALGLRLWLRRRVPRPADFEKEGGT
jgi:Flp pilus assembly protein TadB